MNLSIFLIYHSQDCFTWINEVFFLIQVCRRTVDEIVGVMCKFCFETNRHLKDLIIICSSSCFQQCRIDSNLLPSVN
ncbi:hypothetical protein M5689_007365 [Euphorbia peplus]|nr:hypothetical protein M5689_007365 [Euphorbia peplus]